MNRTGAWNERSLDTETLETAREAARNAGMTLGEWLNSVIRDNSSNDSSARRRPLAPRVADYMPQRPGVPTDTSLPRESLDRARDLRGDSEYASSIRDLAVRERRPEVKTDAALDVLARWMEQNDARQQAEERRRAEREDRSITTIGEAIGLVARRLDALDKKIAGSSDAGVAPLRGMLEKLDRQVGRIAGESRSPEQAARVERTLGELESRLGDISRRIDAATRAGGQDGERSQHIARIETKLARILDTLETRNDSPVRRANGASVKDIVADARARRDHAELAPVARIDPAIEARLAAIAERLEQAASRRTASETVGPSDVAQIRTEIETLAVRIEDAMRRADGAGLATLHGEISALREEIDHAAPSRMLQTVSKAIDDLGRRVEQGLDRLERREPVADFAKLNRHLATLNERMDDRGDETSAGDLAALRAEIASLRAEIAATRPGPELGQLNRGLSEVGQRVDRALSRLESGSNAPALERIRDDVASLRDEMTERMGDRAFDEIRRAISALGDRLETTRAVEPGDAGAINALRQEISGMTQRFERTAKDVASAGSLEALRDELTQLRAVVAEAAPLQAIAGVRSAIDELSDRFIGSAKSTTSGITREVRAVSGEIREALGAFKGIDTLATLGDRIDALTAKVDVLSGMTPDQGIVHQLSDQIADLRSVVAERSTPDALRKLERQIDSMTQRFAAAPDSGSAESLATLTNAADELRRLSERFDPAGAMAAIETRIGLIDDKLERVSRDLAAKPVAKAGKTTTIDTSAIEQMLESLSGKMDSARDTGSGSAALEALERQISSLAGRLSEKETGVDLGPIERSIQDLFVQFDDMRRSNRDIAETAARTAAETVVRDTMERARFVEESRDAPRVEPDPGIAAIQRDLSTLARSRIDVDRRTQDTLEAVHAALEKVVDKLSSLERSRVETRAEMPVARPLETAPAKLAEEPATGGRMAFWRSGGSKATQTAAPAAEQPAAFVPQPVVAAPTVDLPLEPGSGRPGDARPAAASAAVAAASAKPLAGSTPEPSVDARDVKTNYIAAARRAAQAAASETASARSRVRQSATGSLELVAAAGDVPSRRDQIVGFVESRKRPIILGLAALVMAIGTLHVVRGGLGHSDEPAAETPLTTTPATPEAPPKDAVAPPVTETPAAPAPAGSLLTPPDAPRPSQPRSSQLIEPAEPVTVGAIPALGGLPLTVGSPAPRIAEMPELPIGIGGALLREAAAKGDPAAAFEVGSRIVEGKRVGRDIKLAIRWFEKSAGEGYAPAQYRLGNIFEKGIGVQADASLAKLWYERAAAKGNAKALHNLGVLVAEGVDGRPDYALAAELFQKASDLGVRDSQYNLAILMARGLGLKQNLVESYRWLTIAATQGDEEAARKRDEVGQRLQPDEVAKAKRAAEVFRPGAQDETANVPMTPAGGWDGAAPKVSTPKPQGKRGSSST